MHTSTKNSSLMFKFRTWLWPTVKRTVVLGASANLIVFYSTCDWHANIQFTTCTQLLLYHLFLFYFKHCVRRYRLKWNCASLQNWLPFVVCLYFCQLKFKSVSSCRHNRTLLDAFHDDDLSHFVVVPPVWRRFVGALLYNKDSILSGGPSE